MRAHLEVGGWANKGCGLEAAGQQISAAENHGTWLVLAATVPFASLSWGEVGRSDGWTGVAENFQMDSEFDQAPGGTGALTGELEPDDHREFTLALAFGDSLCAPVLLPH